MDTLQATPARPVRRGPRLDISRWSGVLYAALVVASFVAAPRPSLFQDSPQDYAAFYREGADVGWAVMLPGLSLIALLWTLARLRAALPARDGDVASAAVSPAGILLAAAAAGTAASTGAMAFAVDHVEELTVGVQAATTAIVLDSAGEIFSVIWFCAAAVLVWAVALTGQRASALPGWIVWVGFILAPLLPFGWLLFGLPMLVFLVWLATVAAIVPIRR